VRGFVAYLASGGRSRKTVENVLLTLSSLLRTAKARGCACGDFHFADLTLPREGVLEEPRCFTDDEVRRIIAGAREPLSTIVAITAVLGLRIGETLALRVSDVDFAKHVIRIRQSVDAATRAGRAVPERLKSAALNPQVVEERMQRSRPQFVRRKWTPSQQRCSILVKGAKVSVFRASNCEPIAQNSERNSVINLRVADGDTCRELPAGLLPHKSHVAKAIVKAGERHEERLGDNLLDEMRRVQRKAWELLAKTESDGDHRGALVALREVRECLESLGKMLPRSTALKGHQRQSHRGSKQPNEELHNMSRQESL
jgi:hypothetical protein